MENLKDNFVHKIKENGRDIEPAKTESAGYSDYGNTVEISSSECYAKEIFDPDTQKKSFFVRQASSGHDAGHFLNPRSPFYNDGNEKRTEAKMGKRMFEFVRVTEEKFNHYIRFLQTGNQAWLRIAERA